jgi:hypothetical protein
VVLIEATPLGMATVERVGKAAEAHLGDRLAGMDALSRRRLQAGLRVLRQVFDATPAARAADLTKRRRTTARSLPSNT